MIHEKPPVFNSKDLLGTVQKLCRYLDTERESVIIEISTLQKRLEEISEKLKSLEEGGM